MMSDATYAKHAVVANLEPLLPATQWALVERAFRAGSGLLVRFDQRLLPGAARHLERLAALGDPQLATPVEYGVEDDEAWVLYAGTLDDALDALTGPLSMGEIAQLGDALVAGLERAHEQGFVHPGIAASLVRMHIGFDGRVHPELLGLGLPSMTPRTVQDDLADVAALLYTLYTGRPPFEPGAPRDGSQRVRDFAEVRPGGAAPLAFENAIRRALGPRAEAFWTASEMRAALAVAPSSRRGARASATTDPNLPRVVRREISVVAPLPITAAMPVAPVPAQAPEPTLATGPAEPDWHAPPAPPKKKRTWLWALAGLLLVGAGVGLGIAVGGGGDPAATAATPPREAVASTRPEAPPPAKVSDEAHPEPMVAKAEPKPPAVEAKPATATSPSPLAATAPATPATPATVAATTETPPVPPAEPDKPAASVDTPKPAEPAKPVEPTKPLEPAKPVEPPKPTPTKLGLTSDPAGATVKVGNVERGETPLTLELLPTDVPLTLTFERRGFLPAEKKIEALTGASMELAVVLRPRPRGKPATPGDKPVTPPGGPILLGR